MKKKKRWEEHDKTVESILCMSYIRVIFTHSYLWYQLKIECEDKDILFSMGKDHIIIYTFPLSCHV